MNYKGYRLQEDRGEWLVFNSEDELVGSGADRASAGWLVDELYRQGVNHESELV